MIARVRSRLLSRSGHASSSCSYAAVALARSIFAKARISRPRWRSRWLPQSRRRARHHHVALLGWQLTLGRIRRRAAHGRSPDPSLSGCFSAGTFSNKPKNSGQGRCRPHGRPCRKWTCPSPWVARFGQRMTSDRGLTGSSHYFVMDWAAVWLDVSAAVIAGASRGLGA